MSVNLVQKPRRRAHHYFIPSLDNDHKPHFLRHGALHFYSAALIAVKVFVIAFLFITYPSIAEFSTVTSNRIIELSNNARADQGLPVLMRNSTLDESAMLKAQDMVANNYFAHDDPVNGTTPWEWFKAAGYNYTFAGENLAMNFSEAEEAMDAWMDSPTHKANILNANYNEIGVAVVVGNIDGRETTIVVQHFGKSFLANSASQFTRPSGEAAPAVAGTTQVSSGEAVEVTFKNTPDRSWATKIAYYAKRFFFILLVFIVINLLLTIFIRVKIQHKPIIMHAILVVIIGLLSLLLNPHFLEGVYSGTIRIL